MIGKERPEFLGPIGQRQKHVRNEAGFLLYREDAVADIFRQLVEGGRRETFCKGLRHGEVPGQTA